MREDGQIVSYLPGFHPCKGLTVMLLVTDGPDIQSKNDGILLTVVLDAIANNSYLLLLGARDCLEIAPASIPQQVPFGFHRVDILS
jgi:carotenoid cleavage dioxygenase-like enzyme